MNFIEAIILLNTSGTEAVRRCNWEERKYIFIDNSNSGKLSLGLDRCDYKGFYLPYSASMEDVLSEDWEVYEKSLELFTFEQALTALKNGKKIRRQSSISEYHLDKASSRILEIYDVEVRNGEAWWAEAFSDKEVLANDWIILDK